MTRPERCTLPQPAQDGFARWLQGVMQDEYGHLGRVEVTLGPWTWASVNAAQRGATNDQ
jgi:hypothetical protein